MMYLGRKYERARFEQVIGSGVKLQSLRPGNDTRHQQQKVQWLACNDGSTVMTSPELADADSYAIIAMLKISEYQEKGR
jgi:hypothetical protein